MSTKITDNNITLSPSEVYSLRRLLNETIAKVFVTLKNVETVGDIAKEGKSEINIARMGSIISTLSYGLTLHVSRNAALINNIVPDTFRFDEKGDVHFRQ